MIKKICILILVLLCSCQQTKPEQKQTSKTNSKIKADSVSTKKIKTNHEPYRNTYWKEIFKTDTIKEIYWKKIITTDSLSKIYKHALLNSFPLKDKTVTFLWEDKKFYPLINGRYCETMSEPERAALGYLTILYGTANYCYFKKDKDNEYTMRHALNLDSENDLHYHKCTNQFMNYMQFWFRNDSESLSTITADNCHSAIATGQSTYYYLSKINLTIKGNKIYAYFIANAYIRSDYDIIWNKKFTFLVDKDNIKLIEEKELDEEYVYYYPNGSGIDPPDGYVNNGKGEYHLPKKSKKK